MRPNPYGALAASRREIEAGIDADEIARRTSAKASSAKAWA